MLKVHICPCTVDLLHGATNSSLAHEEVEEQHLHAIECEIAGPVEPISPILFRTHLTHCDPAM